MKSRNQSLPTASDLFDIEEIKKSYWSDNPTLPEEVVDEVVDINIEASLIYHMYITFNNEAS